MRTNSVELVDKQKFLIEELGVREGCLIEVQGSTPIKTDLSKFIDINLKFGDKITTLKMAHSATVKNTIDIVRQIFDVVPNTVKLFYKNIELRDYNKLLKKDYKLSNNDTIEVKGSFFPLSFFNGQVQFLENLSMYPNPECLICLEKNDNYNKKYFDCGHGNVCDNCLSSYKSKELCPLCINKEK